MMIEINYLLLKHLETIKKPKKFIRHLVQKWLPKRRKNTLR